MLNNLTIRASLIFVIGFLSVLAIVIGLLGLRGMSVANEGLRTVYEDRLIAAGELAEVNVLTAENLRQVHLMLMHDPRLPESKLHDHPLSLHSDKMEEGRKRNNAILEAYRSSQLAPEEAKLFDEYQAKRKLYQAARTKSINLIREGRYADANAVMVKEVGPAFAVNKEAVQKLLEFQIEVGKNEYGQSVQAYALTRNVSIGAITLGILLAALFGALLIRKIVNSINTAQQVAGAIAGGDLNVAIDTSHKDEIGVLLVSMKSMQDNLRGIVSDIRTIVADANKGDYSKKIDMTGKAGYTKELSELLNQLSDTVDGAFKDTIRVAEALARGDLSQKVTTEYVGAYNQVKVAVNGTVDSLTRIVADIQTIVADANKGDYSRKIDMSGKAGYTKTLSELLNQLSNTVDGAFKDTIRVAEALARGDLSQKVTTEYVGAYNQVKVAVNGTVDSLTHIVGEIREIVDGANKGDFTIKMELAGKAGYTKELSDLLNQLSDTVDGAFKDTIRVAEALARGDLSQKVTTDYVGAYNQVKVAVNTTADSLTSIVGEIRRIVDLANKGDFSSKMDLAGKAGYTKELSELLNQLSDTVDGAFKDTIRVAEALARGDLSQKVTTEYVGAYNQVKIAVNTTADSLTSIVGEIRQIVDAANKGSFEYKMKMEGKAGYTKELSELLNQLSNTVDGAFKDTIRVAEALARGDLSEKVLTEYQGAYNQVKTSVNSTAEALTKIVGEIQNIVEAATKGDFSIKMDMSDKRGYTKTLSELLNLLSDTVDTAFKDTIYVAQALAKGDLTKTVTREYQGAYDEVKQSVNGTVTNLKALVGEIKAATDTINTASKEIAAGNSDLSQRTEEQASSLEETASSMEELTSTVKQNAENAKQANQLAIGASDVAGKGGAVVGEVVTTMSSINESSRKIVDIISVIDGIAFQTNILALNAAVEAARAGEQGRGFAVVAGEVRNLAQRSAAAAKEIKTLIGDSVEKVEGGSKLVAQAGQTMEEIVTSIKRVTDIMSEITAASAEQSQGIEQVNTAITQMDEVTQQNAALVEEAAAAAESLEEQAQTLAMTMATFKVDESVGQAVAVRAPSAVQAAPAARRAPAPARKQPAQAKAAPEKQPAAAKPKPASGDEEDWKEF